MKFLTSFSVPWSSFLCNFNIGLKLFATANATFVQQRPHILETVCDNTTSSNSFGIFFIPLFFFLKCSSTLSGPNVYNLIWPVVKKGMFFSFFHCFISSLTDDGPLKSRSAQGFFLLGVFCRLLLHCFWCHVGFYLYNVLWHVILCNLSLHRLINCAHTLFGLQLSVFLVNYSVEYSSRHCCCMHINLTRQTFKYR